MNPVTQPHAEVISPAEAQFWQDWANKAPALIRKYNDGIAANIAQKMSIGTVLSAGVGVALGIATFTKHVPGKWKWVTGAGAGAALAGSVVGASVTSTTNHVLNEYRAYADLLEKDPQANKILADFLSKYVSAEDIQQHGIEGAVMGRIMDFYSMNSQLLNQRAASVLMGGQTTGAYPCR